jgi:uncharacterized protein YrrD
MLLATSAVKGYSIEAQDGVIGTVKDMLFDDRTWQIKWLVIDTGSWLVDRKVLLHPSAIASFDFRGKRLKTTLTKIQVEESPDLKSDQPVSRLHESNTYDYYGWDPLWGNSMYGSTLGGQLVLPPLYFGSKQHNDEPGHETPDNVAESHVRSFHEITGYHIQATDGDMGHVDNLLFDNEQWGVRYLIVDTGNWWMGKKVLISPFAVTSIAWSDRTISIDVNQAQVKASPEWDPNTAEMEDHQHRLHAHYGWTSYGW